MKLAYTILGKQQTALKHYAEQLGVKYAVASSCFGYQNPYKPYCGPWDYMYLREIKEDLLAYGMEWKVFEGVDFIDAAKLGGQERDEQIGHFCTLLENLSLLGVDTVCYNWMPVWGWYRTNVDIQLNGGSKVTGFRMSDLRDAPKYAVPVRADQLWSNLEYFLKRVVPVAEKYKVRLAIHPDDPPVKAIAGVDRILTNAEAMRAVTKLVPSKYNGITLCQGTFATMGEDIIKCIHSFAKDETLFFVHFRDIVGDAEDFHETYHNKGKTDMYMAMKTYYDVGFDGIMRPDHVPTMYGDSNDQPAYSSVGNLFATGYMLGLMEAVEKEKLKAR